MSDRERRISSRGLELIKRFEGFRPKSEDLGDGRWIIGYGHTRSARRELEISKRDAEALLSEYDLPPIEHFIANNVFAPLSQNAFDGLVSFAFGIGLDRFKLSQVLAHTNAGNMPEAALAMAAWRKARLNGRLILVDGLVRRRAAEAALLMETASPPPSVPAAIVRPEFDVISKGMGKSDWTSPTVQAGDLDENRPDPDLFNGGAPDQAPEAMGEERFTAPLDPALPLESDEATALVNGDEPPSHTEPQTPEMAVKAVSERLTRILGEPPVLDPVSEEAEAHVEPELPAPPGASEDDDEGEMPSPVKTIIDDVLEPNKATNTSLPPVLEDFLDPLPEADADLPDVSDEAGDPPAEPLARTRGGWLAFTLVTALGAVLTGFGLARLFNILPGIGLADNLATPPALIILGTLILAVGIYYLIKSRRS